VQPVFFHVDLDAFFASVEQLDNPQYRGKPVIVGGDPGKRGVVSTCSYEARTFGVRSAMPMSRAVSLCPHAIFLPGRMHRYCEASREVMRIFADFSPDVQQISIDEAFLDMTGTERLFGDATETAKRLKARVREETGLTVSVGVAPNRYLSKISSGLSKPDGLVIVRPGEEESFMAALPLKDVWGIGEKTRERLAGAGLTTVRALLECSEQLLSGLLGPASGCFLHTVLRGVDPGICSGESASRSMSMEHTFGADVTDMETIRATLLELSSELMFRLLDEGVSSRTVHLKLRYGDFTTVSIQDTADTSIRDSSDLYARALSLFGKKYERGNPVRLLGLGVFNVTDVRLPEQSDLFEGPRNAKRRKVEEAVLSLSKKRGDRALIKKARLIDYDRAEDE
jgi:DNA polymerase IV